MKIQLFLFAFILTPFLNAETDVQDFQALKNNFTHPPKEFGSAPLYVWNDDMNRQTIDRYMIDFKEKNFGGVMVHPRPGLITEYLSDDWFTLYKYTLDKGKSLDMDVWIYDENSYPSGFAGGHVNASMPESYNQGQSLRLRKFNELPEDAAKYYLCLKKTDAGFIDVTEAIKKEPQAPGEYYTFEKGYEGKHSSFAGFTYVDLLVPGVTEKFIEITMAGYEKVAGDEFGKHVPGIFQDEAQIRGPGGIRWTPDLFDVFEKRWGYDLRLQLPSLVEETGDWKKVRHDHIETLLHLFIERWAKPYAEYCASKNLKFTGHYWEHEWPDMSSGGDSMAMYSYHSMPGVDMLFNQFNEQSPQAQFGNVRAIKELSSVANQMGYKRTLSETYGGGGWEETFKDFKRLGDWEYALGVNFLNQHLSHSTLMGARKIDYPPVFSYHSPWWEQYGILNLYYARLSLALSSGQQKNDILVLEPNTTLWLYFSYDRSNGHIWNVANEFQAFVTKLEKSQVEYDLGSENIIKNHGSIKNGKFVVGKASYSRFVIPPQTENIDSGTFELLKQFAKAGGSIICFSEPTLLDGSMSEDVKQFFASDKNVTKATDLDDALLKERFANRGITFTKKEGGNLFHHRRSMQDGYILFLANADMNEYTNGSIEINGKDVIAADLFSGQFSDYPETKASDNSVSFDFTLPPAGSALLYIFNQKQSNFSKEQKPASVSEVKPVSEMMIKPEHDNVLTIDFCDLETNGKNFSDIHVFEASEEAFKANNFGTNPWHTGTQYKKQILDRDNQTVGGFKAEYKFTVNDECDVSQFKAVIERPEIYTVKINGKIINPLPDQWWLDRAFGVFSIGSFVTSGENTLSIEVAPFKIHAEIDAVYILGNFCLKPEKKGWSINPPESKFHIGSWKTQGWPFYAKGVNYAKAFEVSNLSDFYEVHLGKWQGTVCEVFVNTKSAGIIIGEPNTIDVSRLIKKGKNIVQVKVIGSNRNLLGPLHREPTGFLTPWTFRGIKEYPSGDKYQQLDYGLMDDFSLFEGKIRR